MCGIAGWFDTVGERPAERSLLKAMTDAIAHRGPDGEGFHFAPGIGLGFRRLAVIDLNTGNQPMYNATKTTCIIYNGEIYNFRELRKALEGLGHRFVTTSDTEVILHAYDAWGTDCLERLHGMFALALWDAPERSLLLARDRIGEKPLYYSELPDGTVIFGSELKALMVNPSLRREIDPLAVEEYFALGYIAEPRTIYKSVRKLPAGSRLVFQRGRAADLRPYWTLKPAIASEHDLTWGADALIEKLGDIVRAELVADVPVGSFLSGGTDSSGTTALIALAREEPVTAFTIGFHERDHDETRHASAVAKRYGLNHIVERMSGDEIATVFRLPKIFDEPYGDSSALPSLALMSLARKHVTVALSGDGGDELFAGYRRYGFHLREEAFRAAVPAWVRQPVFGALARLYPQLDWAPRPLRARHTFREMSLDSVSGYFWNVSVVDDHLREQLFSPELQSSLGGYSASEVIREAFASAPSGGPLMRAQYVDIKTWLPGDILTKVDRTAMASSLEVRVPMLDHTFVEWALGLPVALKNANGRSKILLKKAFERLVPSEALYRPKQGFTPPGDRGCRGGIGVRLGPEVRTGAGLVRHGLFDETVAGRLIDQHRSGRNEHSRVLWLLWMFQRFLTDVDAAPAHRMPEVA